MYHDLEAQLHDAFWQTEDKYTELNLLENFLTNHPGTALELGVGSGRLLAPLLEKGFLIEGLDNSPEMLHLCQTKCAPHSPLLHDSDMATFSTGSTYSAITIPAFTLQFIPPEQLTSFFTNVHHHLHPGGGLYITTFIPWAEITGDLEEDVWFPDHEITLENNHQARCTTRFQIKRLSQQLTREHLYEVIDQQGNILKSSTSTHHLHWFWHNELNRILTETGFQINKVLGDFDPETPCDENSQIITIMAKRTGELK